jgi:hypothetical protein
MLLINLVPKSIKYLYMVLDHTTVNDTRMFDKEMMYRSTWAVLTFIIC